MIGAQSASSSGGAGRSKGPAQSGNGPAQSGKTTVQRGDTTGQDEKIRAALVKRDLSVDLTRALCLLAVVAIHTCMLGISVDAEGGIHIEDPLTGLWFFAVGTWFGQVMPLFFLLGGFAGFYAMRGVERRGESFRHFLRIRILRLGQSAALFYTVIAVVFTLLVAAGLPEDLVTAALRGAGLMLWFMAAFLICQGFIRFQYRLVRGPSAKPALLACLVFLLLAAGVDAARFFTTGGEGEGFAQWFDGDFNQLGLLNLWTVWPLLQLLGMMLARGFFEAIPRWGWALVSVAGFLTTAALARWTYYSDDMLTNLNPPTVPLISIGVMQLGLFQLLRPGLRWAAQTAPGRVIMGAVGPRAMNLYLWHLLVMIGVNGLCLLIGFLPAPGGGVWWLSRIPVFLLVVLVTLALVWKLAVLERGSLGGNVPVPLIWVALFAAALPNIAVTRMGMDLSLAWAGTGMTVAAVLMVRPAWLDRTVGRLRG